MQDLEIKDLDPCLSCAFDSVDRTLPICMSCAHGPGDGDVDNWKPRGTMPLYHVAESAPSGATLQPNELDVLVGPLLRLLRSDIALGLKIEAALTLDYLVASYDDGQ